MRVTLYVLMFSAFFCGGSPEILAAQQSSSNSVPSILSLPAGTKVEMASIRPVWAAKVNAGDTLYLQTVFPVTIGSGAASSLALPAGTFVQAKIDSVVKPTRKVQQATLQIAFHKLILANGYVVELGKPGPVPASDVSVKVTTANDLLLDNGSQLEMTFPTALSLDSTKIAQAAALSHAPKPGSFVGATQCRFLPGTPGTPDSWTPGTPGTPPTVIPGGPGMPDTVIPGIPATPPSRIPGTPGTPDRYCPAPPLVVSSVPVPAGALAVGSSGSAVAK